MNNLIYLVVVKQNVIKIIQIEDFHNQSNLI